MATADRIYAGLGLPVQCQFSTEGMELQFSQYQHQSAPVPSTLRYRNCKHRPSWSPTWIHWRLSTRGISDRYLMYAGGLMSPMQRRFSDLVCQPFVTSYVIDAYLCLAMLHAWSLEYQHMMLCAWWWIPTKAERPCWRRPPDHPRNVWLNKVQEDANALLISILWRSKIARGHGAAQRFIRTIRDDDDDDDDDEGCKTCVNNER